MWERSTEITSLSKCQNRHFQEDRRPLFLEICNRKGIRVYDRKTCSPHTCHFWVRDILSEETDCHLTTCTGFWTAWSGLCYVVDERLCWYSSREILVESSSKAFNSREVRHCLMCSEKEINFLAVKYAREVAAKHDLRFLRHKTRQDKFKYVENRIRGPG